MISLKRCNQITKATISFISFVKQGANGKEFLIVKSKKDKGKDNSLELNVPIVQRNDEKRLVTGIVYVPNKLDSQNEFMSEADIERVAHEFMEEFRNIDREHSYIGENITVVESYVAKSDFYIGDEKIIKGTWLITTKVHDDEIWQAIKNKELSGFSMGGFGQRIEHDYIPSDVTKSKEKFDEFNDDLELKDNHIEGILKNFTNSLRALFIQNNSKASGKDFFRYNQKNKEDNMNTKELKEVLKEAIAPLLKRIDDLEQKHDISSGNQSKSLDSNDIKSILSEVIEPLDKRLNTVEKTSGTSNQIYDFAQTNSFIKSDEEIFRDLNILN